MWSTTGATAVVIARTVSLRSSARAARSSAANSRLVIDVPLSSAPMSRAVRGQLDAELVGLQERPSIVVPAHAHVDSARGHVHFGRSPVRLGQADLVLVRPGHDLDPLADLDVAVVEVLEVDPTPVLRGLLDVVPDRLLQRLRGDALAVGILAVRYVQRPERVLKLLVRALLDGP